MIHATLPYEHIRDYGAGYPLTYLFDVPDEVGLVAQKSSSGTSWSNVADAPVGRFDGIEAARFDGTRAFVSVAFDEGSQHLYLRVVRGGEDVGGYAGIANNYDDRDAPVIFTYDDWGTREADTAPSAGMALHRERGLWASGGINSNRVEDWPAISAVAELGYFEPINHGRDHIRGENYGAGTVTPGFTAEQDAHSELVVGKDEILTHLNPPAQSRGHITGFIEPGGSTGAVQRAALAQYGYLVGRAGAGVYPDNPRWLNGTYERWGPTDRTIYAAGQDQAAASTQIINAVAGAVADRRMAHLYSYIDYWTHEAGGNLDTALTTVGARDDIWSVGWGHWALYRRTSDNVNIAGFPRRVGWNAAASASVDGVITMTVPPGIDGDIIIVIHSGGAQSIAGEGWTALGPVSDLGIWWKLADGSDVTVQTTGANQYRWASGAVLRYRNVDPASIAHGRATHSASLTSTAPSLTDAQGAVVRVWKSAQAGRIIPPLSATVTASIVTVLSDNNLLVAEQAAIETVPSLAADLKVSKPSIAATLVLGISDDPTEYPPPPDARRRGAITAAL